MVPAEFSFLNLPKSLLDTSREQQGCDVMVAWQLLVHMDELEANEAYWRGMLNPDKTGKTYAFSLDV
ncbi:MAG: hypothetical protein P4M11_07060 [Candidatus Pacebacteria bacterium]|nr:hypothetical protein [Candidatus Paceibacterota bacterium]